MSEYKIAYRYAKSLLELAEEKGKTELIYQDMVLLNKVVEQNREFRLMLKNPIINHLKKQKILLEIFKGKVNDITKAFFEILTRKNRESVLPEIAKVYQQIYFEKKGIVSAKITTTFPLTADLRQEFINVIQNNTGSSTIDLEEKVDSNLMIGDEQVDDSVSSKLKALKQIFTS